MSAYLFRLGTVLHSSADIDVLAAHAARKVRAREVCVLGYRNGYAVLHVDYTDDAHGMFEGVDADELRNWANANQRWPECTVHAVPENYPIMREEEPPAPAEPPKAVHVRRTRVVTAPAIPHVRRTR
jgi:hypothetical protein